MYPNDYALETNTKSHLRTEWNRACRDRMIRLARPNQAAGLSQVSATSLRLAAFVLVAVTLVSAL